MLFEKFKNYALFRTVPSKKGFVLTESDDEIKETSTENDMISADIDVNYKYIKERFNYPVNNDIVIRKIELKNEKRAFLVFIDGMVDTEIVNDNIIQSLQAMPYVTFSKNKERRQRNR